MGCESLARTGYEGQGYEVVAITRDGEAEGIGWTEDADGGNLARGVKAWPKYLGYDVLSVETGEVVNGWRAG